MLMMAMVMVVINLQQLGQYTNSNRGSNREKVNELKLMMKR